MIWNWLAKLIRFYVFSDPRLKFVDVQHQNDDVYRNWSLARKSSNRDLRNTWGFVKGETFNFYEKFVIWNDRFATPVQVVHAYYLNVFRYTKDLSGFVNTKTESRIDRKIITDYKITYTRYSYYKREHQFYFGNTKDINTREVIIPGYVVYQLAF